MKKIAIILALMLVLGTVLVSGCTQIPSMGGEDQGSGQDGGQDSDSGSGDDNSGDNQGDNGDSGSDERDKYKNIIFYLFLSKIESI